MKSNDSIFDRLVNLLDNNFGYVFEEKAEDVAERIIKSGIFDTESSMRPTTNADRIRAMSDEELADQFSLWCCRSTTDDSYCKSFGTCDKCWLDWLRQEAKDA